MDGWDFLEQMDKNILYSYAELITGKHTRFAKELYPSNMRDRKKLFLYCLWVVYRYGFDCKTYEETIPYQKDEIYERYKFKNMVKSSYMFIGLPEAKELYNVRYYAMLSSVSDISAALKILYERADILRELEIYEESDPENRKRKFIAKKIRYGIENLKENLKKSSLTDGEDITAIMSQAAVYNN